MDKYKNPDLSEWFRKWGFGKLRKPTVAEDLFVQIGFLEKVKNAKKFVVHPEI